MRKKRERDFIRVAAMADYVDNDDDCRQRVILKYFGEDPKEWSCGVCDLCLRSKMRS